MFKNFRPRNTNKNRIIDKEWVKIFEDFNVLEKIKRDGIFEITAPEIKRYKEPRLMTKFDYVSQLPDIFYNNHLTIMPTRRGTYVIGHFDAYYEYEKKITDEYLLEDRTEMPFPSWIESLDVGSITSESAMLNAAIAGNLVSDLFGKDDYVRTVDGRMSSLDFSFNINHLLDTDKSYTLNVENSQMEIDGGYESSDKLILIEAKNNVTDSFLVRQLYYPFQRWARQVDKEVYPVFLQYSNNTYNFSVFRFADINDYNSLELVERKNYIFVTERTTLDDLVRVAKSVTYRPEPVDIPTGQADTFARIYNLLDSIWEDEDGRVTLEDIALENDFTMRQSGYYSNAGRYLDLIVKNEDRTFSLSPIGEEFVQSNKRERDLIIARQMLQYEKYNLVFREGLKSNGEHLTQSVAHKVLTDSDYYERAADKYAESTRERRAGTVSSWVKHLFELVK